MAKIKLPSYIKEGHGRMEDAVLVTRNGVSYMMVYKKISQVKTVKQLAAQDAFTTVVADWKYLTGIIRKAWDIYSDDENVSGYNSFMGVNIPHRRAGESLELCPGTGEEILMNFTAAPGASAGEIVCSFLPPEEGCRITFFSRKETNPGIKSSILRHEADEGTVSTFTITGLETGEAYSIYAVITDAQYDSALTISQSVTASSIAG